MKLVRGDDALDWRRSFAIMAVIVMIEVVVIAIITTHDIPKTPSPPPRILSATATNGRQGTKLQIQAQDPDAVISQLQIQWGDGHTDTINRGCKTTQGQPLYGGETLSATAAHRHRSVRVRVRATSRSCIQRQPPSTGPWWTATTGQTGVE